jgi:hypothetical protein
MKIFSKRIYLAGILCQKLHDRPVEQRFASLRERMGLFASSICYY